MPTMHLTDMGLSRAKFREIGRIIAYWSLLEYLMGAAVGFLKCVGREEGRRLTLKKKVSDLVKMLRKSARVRKLSKHQTDRMESLIARIEKEQLRRNDVAHGIWAIHDNKWSLLRYKKPDKFKLAKDEPMTARDLQRIADRIETLTSNFERWMETVRTP